jgi:hypothetical protein
MKNMFILVLIAFALGSCSAIKMETDVEKASPVIVYSKGPCFGTCPIYTVTIFNTGLVRFNGVRFTQKDGRHEKQLDPEEYSALIKKFRSNKFFGFKEDYGMEIVDLATITISFNDKGKTKTVRGKSKFPDKLKEIMSMLDVFEKEEEAWVVIEGPTKIEKPKKIIDNQIIITTGDGMILSSWLQKYRDYGLRLMNRISEDENMWLIRFDKTLINPEEMLQMIKADKGIINAEFNAELSTRTD